MASPSAQPQTPPTSVNGIAIPTVPSGSSSSLYGSGAWATAPVQLGPTIPGFGLPTGSTGQDAVKAFAQLKDPSVIAQIEQMLYYGGFYGTSAKPSDIIFGKITPNDVKAMQAATQTSIQAGAPLDSYLTSVASWGKAGNILTSASQIQANTVTHANPVNADAALQTAAEKLLGHDVTADEYAQFRAFYDSAYTQGQKDAIKAQQAQQGTAGMPDQGTLGEAINTLNQPAPAGPGQQMVQTSLGNVPAQTSTQFGPFKTGERDGGDAAFQQTAQAQAAAQSVVGQADQAAQTAAQNVNVTGEPDVNAAAESFIRQNNPGQVAAQDAASKYQTFLSFLASGGK